MEYIPLWERDARKEGEKIGRKEGEKAEKKKADKEKLNIARELIKNGVDINIISRSTGLPLEKLEELTSTVQ